MNFERGWRLLRGMAESHSLFGLRVQITAPHGEREDTRGNQT